ncbi:MAG: hypothetical protein IKU34_10690 [Clostridia bacterium]|nr:hypothetical protein [Clostridia bacterium]
MRNRVFALIALLVCLAATALAGGGQEVPAYFRKTDGESVPDTYIYGENMPEVYTYGGSKRDWVYDMAVAPDGRIAVAGYTESSDGTLSDRTKTWRAGWVMMLDQNMNVLWNFCSRSGDMDYMCAPVFHEDGTLSVVHVTEGKQVKIIGLNEEGKRIKSVTVMSRKGGDEHFGVVGAMEHGYLLKRWKGDPERASYALFDFGGTQLIGYGEGAQFSAVSEKHMIALDNSGLWLCQPGLLEGEGPRSNGVRLNVLDAQGNADRSYQSVVSLADGGAAACGYINGAQGANGLLSRWDARGNLVFEMIVVGNPLKELVCTQDGYAALRMAKEAGQYGEWELVRFDEMGILCGKQTLLETPSQDACCTAVRADGAILCAQLPGLFGNEDVLVTVIRSE